MSERMLHGLDFWLDRIGRMRGIDEVEQGLAYDCECPACGSLLVARMGAVRVHHFAHRGTSCTTGGEIALHRRAKEILADECRLVQPGEDTPTALRDAAPPD